MANYDYGLRGAWKLDLRAAGPWHPARAERSAPGHGGQPLSHRVTARYRLDYVRPARDPHPDSDHPPDDRWVPIADPREYRPPYATRAGMRAGGSVIPRPGYSYPDRGPARGGRYPDDL